MNKKIIILISVLIVIALIGVLIYMFLLKNNNDTNNNNNQIQSNENNTNNNIVTDSSKILVLYFSMSGNTEKVANIIHDNVGGDIIKLETVEEYPSDYDELVDYAQEEQQENARPELSTKIDDIEAYDIIFLGYPNWWGDMPMPIYTFLEEYDLRKKTIAPFITHGGSGLSNTPENIQGEEPEATVTEGLAIYGSDARDSESDVTNWLTSLGF